MKIRQIVFHVVNGEIVDPVPGSLIEIDGQHAIVEWAEEEQTVVPVNELKTLEEFTEGLKICI